MAPVEPATPVEPGASTGPWWRRRAWWLVAAGLVAVVAVGWVLISRSGADDPEAGDTPSAPGVTSPADSTDPPTGPTTGPTGAPTTPPTPTTTPAATDPGDQLDPDAAAAAATDAVTRLLELADAAYAAPDSPTDPIDEVSTGAARDEVEGAVAELGTAQWRQTGTVEVSADDAVSVDVESDPATVTVRVCLDSSGVDIVDANGDSVRSAADQSPPPTSHDYVVVLGEDGAWRVSAHAITDPPDC